MVSIVIVNYRVKEKLLACIQSIIDSAVKSKFEIIVIDNDEEKVIKKDLKKKFPTVKYIANENKGFGQGNNVGAAHSKGEFLFFLNPDTLVYKNTIDNLLEFLKMHKDTGIVAPLLLGKDNKPYQQGSTELTPLKSIFTHSLINRFLPHNPVSKNYYLKDWQFDTVKEVDVAPGTALFISKDLFRKVHGFDEKFFLYFEEFDLCRRIKKLNYKIYITPRALVKHFWGESTKQFKTKDQVFRKSRFYYFKKNFGLLPTLLAESILRIDKNILLLFFIIFLGLLLRVYSLGTTMPFISDQGWFFASARDLILGTHFPLVGIASSHPWLHQGALWTYMISPVLLFSGFNPISVGYYSIFLDLLSLVLVYTAARVMFSKNSALFASVLYAFSPIIIFNSRMPYHTSPVPLVTTLFILFLYIWVRGNTYFFPLVILSLALLYNLNLAFLPFIFIFVLLFLFGLFRKMPWVYNLKNPKIILFSFLAFIIPMLPVLIYDLQNGFPQTVRFAMWIGYRILVFFGYPPLHPDIPPPLFSDFSVFALDSLKKLIFAPSVFASAMIFILSLSFLIYKSKKYVSYPQTNPNYFILSLCVLLPLLSLIALKIPSNAYLPLIFPPLILMLAVFFRWLFSFSYLKYPVLVLLTAIAIFNTYYVITTINQDNGSFTKHLNTSKEIIAKSAGREYNLIKGNVPDDQKGNIKNYEYLIWYLGGEAHSKNNEKLEFTILESANNIKIIENTKNP